MQSVAVRRDAPYPIDGYHSQVEGGDDSVPHCDWVRLFVVGIAFRLA
jgi:hypothetical protein